MTIDEYRYGFRIVGSCRGGERRLVDAAAALAGYADLDERAEVHREAYLSAFTFGEDFREYLQRTGSTKGYKGACWAPWLWFDIDREDDLDRAKQDARRICAALAERYCAADDDLLVFFSGAKGFHVGLPTILWQPEPGKLFNRIARRFSENVAELAGIAIDTGVYDAVRAFRAPNSGHPKTGLHKRWLSVDELMHLNTDAIVDMAKAPEAFDIPKPTSRSEQAATDWRDAAEQLRRQTEANGQRRSNGNGSPTLNRLTFDFIRDGAEAGGHGVENDKRLGVGRHRLLFSAAANLGEFRCPPALAHALLTESGLDSGLSPSEVRRQIDCGLAVADEIAQETGQTSERNVRPADERGGEP